MAFANANFDELVSTSLKMYRGRMTDNITNKEVLLNHFKEKGYVEERSGGTSIVEGLIHGDNDTVGSFSGYDEFSIAPQEGISSAEFDWKQIVGTVSISGEQEFKNSGSKEKIISLLDTKVRQLELSLMKELDRQLLSDGTGNSSKDITGIKAAIPAATSGTYGGITWSSSSNAFWAPNFIDLTTASFAAVGQDNMRTLFNNCSRDGETPTLALTTQTIFERYEKSLVQNERFTDTRLGDAGFQNLMFKGIPIVYDSNVTSGYLYMISREYMRFIFGKGRNFVLGKFQTPINQESRVAPVFVYCQLTLNRRQSHGVIDGLDNA